MRTFRSLFGVFILVATVVVVWRVVPPIWANFQYNQWMVDRARAATYTPKTTQQELQAEALAKAEEFGVPVSSDNLDIVRNASSCTMRASYEVKVDLWVYQFPMKFIAGSSNNHF